MQKPTPLIFAAILALTACANAQQDPDKLFLVADFNNDIQNYAGGYYNKFERAPSTSSTFLMNSVARGSGGKSLRVKANKGSDGFCGVWIQFFDFKSPTKKYFDTTKYKYLSFWVKGEKGGEDFLIKLADQDWIEQEDSLPLGQVEEFLKGGVTQQWKEVIVPLEKYTMLDRKNMGGLTLEFMTPGQQTIYIDDVAFKDEPDTVTPTTHESRSEVSNFVQPPRAMWVWDTKPLLLNPVARQDLFEFCLRENINQLWLQILYAFKPNISVAAVPTLVAEGKTLEVECILHFRDEFRHFIRAAHAQGITVHVLDGYPEFTQEMYHAMPLAIVDAVIKFNKNSEPQERFDGIHFDNEPYLISGTHDDARHEQVLLDFLNLNVECQRRVREQSDMVFGVDIPFFWHERNLETGQTTGEITYNGQSKPASFHCIDLLDNVGIMNYRDTADGADGMIAHGRELLAYADKTKKNGKIYMGIETFSYAPTDVWFAVGLPRTEFAKALKDRGREFGLFSRIDGHRTQIFDDGANIHVGIELPAEPTPEDKVSITATMAKIAHQLGASCDPQLKENASAIRDEAMSSLARHVEWRNTRERDIRDPSSKDKHIGMVATRIMLPKITFAQEPYAEIKTQTAAAEEYFSRYKSYAGTAIHYYATYRKKVEETRETFPVAD